MEPKKWEREGYCTWHHSVMLGMKYCPEIEYKDGLCRKHYDEEAQYCRQEAARKATAKKAAAKRKQLIADPEYETYKRLKKKFRPLTKRKGY